MGVSLRADRKVDSVRETVPVPSGIGAGLGMAPSVVMVHETVIGVPRWKRTVAAWALPCAYAGALLITGASAIVTKEFRATPPLAAIDLPSRPPAFPVVRPVLQDAAPLVGAAQETTPDQTEYRWFNRRPVRPARVVWMTVTAYSPDARSCAPFDDGRTATLHSVYTNSMKLVAADTDRLPFGSLLTIPGYDEARIVPVLDRGAAITGDRLDVLMPTHAQARAWGVREVAVTVWEYADGLPADDPREFR